MLVHKATMGVLDRVWTGKHAHRPDGTLCPIDRPAVLADVDDPEDWWEIPGTGPLARTIRMNYPWIRPETSLSGELTGVVVTRTLERQTEAQAVQEARREEARERGYKRTGRMRPRGLMPFLSCTPTCNDGSGTPQG